MNQEPARELAPLRTLPPRIFETARLKLRALEAADAKTLFDLYAADPVATRYMSFKCTGKLEDTEFFVNGSCRFARGLPAPIEHYTWVITLKNTGEIIGSTGFGPKGKFALAGGYILGPQYWGKGYATEAWSCLVEWAKGEPGVYRIEASHHPENPASGKVLEKSGMRCEGILRRGTITPNVSEEPCDCVLYAWARE